MNQRPERKRTRQWAAFSKRMEEERTGLVVVVGCGREKQSVLCPAGEMYTGSFHGLCLETAKSMRPERLLILSAKYGLVSLTHPLQPYDTRIGDPDAVTPERIRKQAFWHTALNPDLVVVLAGRAYVELARTMWPKAAAPLLGASGIGEMRSILVKLRDRS